MLPYQFPMPTLQMYLMPFVIINAEAKPLHLTTLDVSCTFWQMELDKEAKNKTTFVTRQGKCEVKEMPFGLENAPAAFQIITNQVLTGLT